MNIKSAYYGTLVGIGTVAFACVLGSNVGLTFAIRGNLSESAQTLENHLQITPNMSPETIREIVVDYCTSKPYDVLQYGEECENIFAFKKTQENVETITKNGLVTSAGALLLGLAGKLYEKRKHNSVASPQ